MKLKSLSKEKVEKYDRFLEKFMSNIENFEDEEYVEGSYLAGVVKGVLIARKNFWEIARDSKDS